FLGGLAKPALRAAVPAHYLVIGQPPHADPLLGLVQPGCLLAEAPFVFQQSLRGVLALDSDPDQVRTGSQQFNLASFRLTRLLAVHDKNAQYLLAIGDDGRRPARLQFVTMRGGLHLLPFRLLFQIVKKVGLFPAETIAYLLPAQYHVL